MIQKLKKSNELEYVKQMKELLIHNNHYKAGIEILIDKFKKELNQSEELNKLKLEYKSRIKNDIQKGDFIQAKSKIIEYEDIFGHESENINLKAVIEMLKCNFNESDKLLKMSYLLDKNNYDVIFNIACVKEMLEEYKESIEFFSYIVSNCDDESIVLESKEKIDFINSIKEKLNLY
jgi:hypothetical protein